MTHQQLIETLNNGERLTLEAKSAKMELPRIQNMLGMNGFGENLGSGFPIILNAWKQTGWKAPLLENKIEVDEVALTLFVYDKTAQTSAQTSAQTTIEQVYLLIKENPSITIGEMAELLGRGKRTIQNYINKLKGQNRIRRIGAATFGGKWEVVENNEIDN